MSATLDYANARARARISRALDVEAALGLTRLPTDEAKLAALAPAFPWEPVAAPESVAEVERAWSRALARETELLSRWIPSRRTRERLAEAFVVDDAWTLRVLFRALARGESGAALLERLLPTPALPEPILRELASGTIDDAIARVDPWLGGASRAQPPDFELVITTRANALIRRYSRGFGDDARAVRVHLADSCDRSNARMLLVEPASADERLAAFRDGGARLPRDRYARLAAADAAARRAELAAMRGFFGANEPAPAELADPFRVEALLSAGEEIAARRAARASPLSLAVPIAQIVVRRAELRRVRLALRGSAFGLASRDLRPLMEGA